MQFEIVSTSKRAELAEVTGEWRWTAFFSRRGVARETVLAFERRAACATAVLPQVLVSLSGGVPVGMASLVAQDLDTRPDLTPWLAGVYVLPEHRRQGHAMRLVGAIEDVARTSAVSTLWLYTRSAQPLYRRCGWCASAVFERNGRDYTLMRRDLAVSVAVSP